jgi:hypothetical protein
MIICSSSSDVSDRYNNLKAVWDSLMEAAEHTSPQGFHVAITVVLEWLKRDELKRKSAEPKKRSYFRFFLQAFCFLHAIFCNLR